MPIHLNPEEQYLLARAQANGYVLVDQRDEWDAVACCRTCKAVEILTAKTVEKFTLCRVSRLSACGDDVVNIAFYNLRLVEHDGCQFFCASECSVT